MVRLWISLPNRGHPGSSALIFRICWRFRPVKKEVQLKKKFSSIVSVLVGIRETETRFAQFFFVREILLSQLVIYYCRFVADAAAADV